MALDSALDRLTRSYPRPGQVVELRFFGGMETRDTTEVLQVNTRTVDRDWQFAKAWLHREFGDSPEPPACCSFRLAEACQNDAALLAGARSLVAHGAFPRHPAYALSGSDDLDNLEAGSPQPGDLPGECRVLSLSGEGGRGEGYLTEDTKLGRRVAVKLLKRGLYGGGTTSEGRSYLVMEYVESEWLDRFCDRPGLRITEHLALFRKVCAAVAEAHQNLVVHRDLKPANIRVNPRRRTRAAGLRHRQAVRPGG